MSRVSWGERPLRAGSQTMISAVLAASGSPALRSQSASVGWAFGQNALALYSTPRWKALGAQKSS